MKFLISGTFTAHVEDAEIEANSLEEAQDLADEVIRDSWYWDYENVSDVYIEQVDGDD